VALGLGELGGLPEGAGRAGEGAQGEQVQLVGDLGPGGPGSGLGDADQEQREPAQDDVGADALLFPVIDRAQVDNLLEVAPAALDFQQLLVAQGDVLGRQLGVGRAEQVLAVEVLLGLDGGRVGAQQAAGGDAQVAVQARLGGDDPAQLGPLSGAQLVAAVDHLAELGQHPLADLAVPFGGLGVVADHEPLVLGDADLLDPQVRRDVLVAALTRQGSAGLGGAGAQLLPDDVVVVPGPQVAAVGRPGGPPGGGPPHAGPGAGPPCRPPPAGHPPAARVSAPRPPPRPAPPPGTGSRAGVTAMPITTWGRSSRWSLDLP